MAISIQCAGCGKSYSLADKLAGKKVKCSCGQSMVVPGPEATPIAHDPLDALGDLGPPGAAPTPGIDEDALWDEALPPAEGTTLPTPGGAALGALGTPVIPNEPEPARRKKKKASGKGNQLLVYLAVGGGLAAIAAAIIVAAVTASRPGHRSPEDVFAVYSDCMQRQTWKPLFRAMDPDTLDRYTLLVIDRTQYLASKSGEMREVFARHTGQPYELPTTDAGNDDEETDLEDVFGQQGQATEAWQREIVSKIEDKPTFLMDLSVAIEAYQEKHLPRNPAAKMLIKKPLGEFRRQMADGQLTELTIDGDRATAHIPVREPDGVIEAPIVFSRINGRWFLTIENMGEFMFTPVGESLLLPFWLY